MITPSPATSAAALVYAARKKFCDTESLAALRRHQAIVWIAALFLGPTFIPHPQLVASPVSALMQGPLSFPARCAACLGYLAVIFLAFAWQRPMLRGGAFRAWLATLPLAKTAFDHVDRKMIARRIWIFFLPHVMALRAIHASHATAGDLLNVALAMLMMTIAAWRVAAAAVERDYIAAVIAFACALVCVLAVPYDAIIHTVTLAVASASAWYAPQLATALRRKKAHNAARQKRFHLHAASVLLWLQLPLIVLWHTTRSGVLTRVAAMASLFALSAVGIVGFGMHDRWRGLTASVLGVAVWLFASLYEPIDDARRTMPLWKSLPMPRYADFVSDALAVCAIAAVPIIAYAVALASRGFFAALPIALSALVFLFALRGLLFAAPNWRVPITPPLVVVWALVAAFAT
jgi:hypothetical protein